MVIEYLAQAIVSMEGNVILISVKYLEWRIKFYIELAHVYEEIGAIASASKTVERCLIKIQEAKELEEKDPPLPDYIEKLFANNFRIIRAIDLKLKLQVFLLLLFLLFFLLKKNYIQFDEHLSFFFK